MCVQLGDFYTGEPKGEDYESELKLGDLIDLIEEGDYVNGYPVKRIPNFDNVLCVFDLNIMEWIPLKDIDVLETIVTKEQFEEIGYKIEGE